MSNDPNPLYPLTLQVLCCLLHLITSSTVIVSSSCPLLRGYFNQIEDIVIINAVHFHRITG